MGQLSAQSTEIRGKEPFCTVLITTPKVAMATARVFHGAAPLAEKHQADDKDDDGIQIVAEGGVYHVAAHHSPVEQPPVGAEKNGCRQQIAHQAAVFKGGQVFAQPAAAGEKEHRADGAHYYAAAEDEHGVEAAEQVPVDRLRAPDEVAKQQGGKRFPAAGHHSASLSKDTLP